MSPSNVKPTERPPRDQDPGKKATDEIYQRMMINDQWSVRDGRRFTWWLGNHAQEIYAEPPMLSQGIVVSRLVARTPLVVNVPATPRTHQLVSAFNAQASTLSALVLGNDGVASLVTTAVTYDHMHDWIANHFAVRAAMQAADAEIKAAYLAEVLGGEIAHSTHPKSGPRSEFDELAYVIERLITPAGQETSRWAGEEMVSALDLLRKVCLLAFGDESGVGGEFVYRDFSSLVQFAPNERHMQVGNGLRVTLKLPSLPLKVSACENAVLLNLMEAKGLSLMTTLHGAWCSIPDGDRPDTVAFRAFFPNQMKMTGFAANIALWMSGKAEWVASLGDPRTWEERRGQGGSVLRTVMGMIKDKEGM